MSGMTSMFDGMSDAQIAYAVRMAERHYQSIGRDPVYCDVALSVIRDCEEMPARLRGEAQAERCVECGEDEPRTGACGSSSPRALCNRPQAAMSSTAAPKIDPSWSLHDRIEFALRDAGFDYDEASRVAIAATAAPAPVAGDAVAALPEKWRAEAGESHAASSRTWRSCADELTAALAQDRASQAAPSAHYSIDADPDGIRARVADAITGALAFGAQGTHKPPAGHWLEPFWDMARAEREAPSPPTVSEATARRLDDYLGGEFDIRIGKQAAHGALVHALAQDRASQAGAPVGVPDGWTIKHHKCGTVYIEAEGYGSTILPPGVDDANGIEGALLRLLAIDLSAPEPAAEGEVR